MSIRVVDEKVVKREYDPMYLRDYELIEKRMSDGSVLMERRVIKDDYYYPKYVTNGFVSSFPAGAAKPVTNPFGCNCADKGNVTELKDKIKRMTEERDKQDKEVETLATECDNLATEYERVVVALDVMRSRVEYAEEEALRAWEWVERTKEAV